MSALRFVIMAMAMFVTMAVPSYAAVIANLGVNPNSAGGNFQSSPSGLFTDQVQFQLIGGPQFLTIHSATNTFAQVSDRIDNFTLEVFGYGDDGLFQTADDVSVIGSTPAGPCNVPNCQDVASSGILGPGLFYTQFTGNAGSTAGYAGNISTAPVSGVIPLPAALPMFGAALAIIGLFGLKRRR